ncbi:hypothetical protein BN1058_01856 [Paraliobacillus sp. PM-2]|uniref:DUF5412 family protein n=1 Tax=Paraliobacillus sp. PM-2 TaxID=1462524 RepID=UPI00061B9DA1|nr:DUF5412 family protein [Paraliobacillus sp. PM-2]CQR47532.1 hypothetical protein BN1058_01856 [Paraliobacillus sp. PM-2]
MSKLLYTLHLMLFFTSGLILVISLISTVILILFFLKKKKIFPRKTIIIFGASCFIFIILFYNHYYNLNYLPQGILNDSIEGPDDKYSIRTYHFDGFYGLNAKASLFNNETGEEDTIYFNWYDYDPKVIWLNEKEVRIGREELNVFEDKYDYRHDKNYKTLPSQRELHY